MRPSVDRLVLAEEGKEPEEAPEEDEEEEPEEFAEPAAAGSTMKLSSKPIERVRFSLNVVFWKWLSSTDSTCCDVVGPSLKTSLDMVLCVESGWRRKLRRGALVGAVVCGCVRLPFFSVPMHGGVDSGRTPGDAAGRDGATEQKK